MTRVVIDPYVVLSILDHHSRREDEEDQVHGLLLGQKGKGLLRVTNFVPVLNDQTFHELTVRSCPADNTLGWYATDPTLSTEIDRVPLSSLFIAVHTPSQEHPSIRVKAFRVERVLVEGQEMRTFKSAPCVIEATSAPSAVAVDTIVRSLFPEEAAKSDPATVSSIVESSETGTNAMFAEFQQLRRNLKAAQSYCQQAAEGKVAGDASLGRKLSATLHHDLSTTLSASPSLARDIENTSQDSLMISYIMKLLANKTTQLRQSYHEALENLVSE